MQLPGLIVLLLLLFVLIVGNDGVSSSFSSDFSSELSKFQDSLIEHIVKHTSLDPHLDDRQIQTVARAIIDEAERRIRKRDALKRRDEGDNGERRDTDEGESEERRDTDEGDKHSKAVRFLANGLYRDLLKLHELYKRKEARSKDGSDNDDDDGNNEVHDNEDRGNDEDVVNDIENDNDDDTDLDEERDDTTDGHRDTFSVGEDHTRGQTRREIDEAEYEERYIDNTRRKKEVTTAADPVWDRESRLGHKPADVGDNEQVAKVSVDNTDDLTTRIAARAKHLLLEPYLNVSHDDNQTAYKLRNHHGAIDVQPPQKVVTTNKIDRTGLDKFSFIAVVVACCVAGIAGIMLASFCWYKLRSETKEYKSPGTGDFKPGSLRNTYTKGSGVDETKLAQGAEVFHYLHAKKQIQQMEEPSMKASDRGVSINESTDEDEEEEDTVYECPGLAPPGDMRVVNPLFSDNDTHYNSDTHTTPSPPLQDK